jgi:signal peptidase II
MIKKAENFFSLAQSFFIPFFILVLDQLTKHLAGVGLVFGDSKPIIPGIFHLTLVYNKGAAFGLFKGGTFFFTITSIICIVIIILLCNNHSMLTKIFGLDVQNRIVRFSLGLILGGACGNLIDRLRFSYVVDFLDFRVWPVFNVADSAITIGGILLLIKIIKNSPSMKN